MAARRHTHTYERFKRGQRIYFRCTDPHCTHYLERELVLGKACKCFICGAEFVLDYEDLKRKRPRCIKCSDTKKGQQHRAARAILEDIFRPFDDPMKGEM